LADLKAEVKGKSTHWENEKKSISKIREIKERIEKTKQEMKEAEREVNYTRLAELQYGEMSQLEKELKQEEQKLVTLQKDVKMLKEEVDEEDVARLSRSGQAFLFPGMLEGEVEKLIHMEERLRKGSSVRTMRSVPFPMPVRRSRTGLAGPQPAHWIVLFMGPTG